MISLDGYDSSISIYDEGVLHARAIDNGLANFASADALPIMEEVSKILGEEFSSVGTGSGDSNEKKYIQALTSIPKIRWMFDALSKGLSWAQISTRLGSGGGEGTYLLSSLSFQPDELSILDGGDPMPTADFLVQLEFYLRGVFRQHLGGVSQSECKNWVEQVFYPRVQSLDIHTPRGAENYTNQSQVIEIVQNTLKSLRNESLLPENAKVVALGTGPAHVEAAILEGLMGEEGSHLRPSIAIGIEPLPQSTYNPLFEMFHGDLHSFVENNPNAQADLGLEIGSVLLNMESLITHLEYQQKINQMLKTGGILVRDVGSIDPGEENYRRSMALKMNKVDQSKLFGVIGLLEQYRDGEGDSSFGAHQFPHLIYMLLARLGGFEVINRPFKSSCSRQLIMSEIQDESLLEALSSTSTQDALDNPFYNVRHSGGKKDDYRAVYVMKKVGNVHPILPLLINFLSSLPQQIKH